MAKKEITDFGSKIGGARKDVWIKRGLCVEDIKDMTASEKEKYIKRDYIWPKPDIQEELEKGFSRFIVYWHNEMRKTVTSKKNSYISAEEFSCPVSNMFSTEYSFCSLECEKKFPDIIARKEKLKKEKQKKQAEGKLQKYIQKNGLCSICKTSYVDCERMQSNFRCYPKGSSCKGNLVIKCPKFTK